MSKTLKVTKITSICRSSLRVNQRDHEEEGSSGPERAEEDVSRLCHAHLGPRSLCSSSDPKDSSQHESQTEQSKAHRAWDGALRHLLARAGTCPPCPSWATFAANAGSGNYIGCCRPVTITKTTKVRLTTTTIWKTSTKSKCPTPTKTRTSTRLKTPTKTATPTRRTTSTPVAVQPSPRTSTATATRTNTPVLKLLGASCSSPTECQTGYCVDSVCCNTACNSLCSGCSAAKKGSGISGTCGFVAAGTDPDNECADQGASSCGTNGFCSGNGTCALYPAGTPCWFSPICWDSTTLVKDFICNDRGVCWVSSFVSCLPYRCSANACSTTCSSDADCLVFVPNGGFPFYCSNNQCVPRPLPPGSRCSSGNQCMTGFCSSGVCCNTACNTGFLCTEYGVCYTSCSSDVQCAPGYFCNETTCSSLKATGASCGRDGQCSTGFCQDGVCCNSACNSTCNACSAAKKGAGVDGTCGFAAVGTTCSSASCESLGTLTKPSVCTAEGSCVAGGTQACSPYHCSSGACATNCTATSDCASGYYCSGANTCLAQQSTGTTCSSMSQCATGWCVEGFCCDSGCTSTCHSCSAATKGSGANGICGPVADLTDPWNECTGFK